MTYRITTLAALFLAAAGLTACNASNSVAPTDAPLTMSARGADDGAKADDKGRRRGGKGADDVVPEAPKTPGVDDNPHPESMSAKGADDGAKVDDKGGRGRGTDDAATTADDKGRRRGGRGADDVTPGL